MKKHKIIIYAACIAMLCVVALSCKNGNCIINYTGGYDGIDVSHHQGKIDWNRVSKDKNIKFVYIKATEGSNFVDKKHNTNLNQARKNGLKCGSYHYFNMKSSAMSQFHNFTKNTNSKKWDIIPMIDIETDANGKINGYNIKPSHNNQRQAVIAAIKQLSSFIENEYGCKPILYCSYYVYDNIIRDEFEGHKIFIARYEKKTGVDNYTIWQYSEKGKVCGINTFVDLNRFGKGMALCDIEYKKS